MARALLALLLVFAGAGYAHEPDALAELDACAGKLDPSLDVGYERVAARCPDLTARLEQSPWGAWLPAEWKTPRNQLNAESLRALHDALLRESSATSGARELHPQRMQAVLARLAQPQHGQDGWWARLKRWLRELLTRAPRDDNDWLRRLLGEVSVDKAVLRLLVGISIAVLVALALAVVANELRVAGLLRRGAPRSGPPPGGRAPHGALDLSDLEAAEPGAQPALLLELIAARLAAQDRLPPARAFTVRELLRRARLRDQHERACLAELASTSERVRYAAGGVTPAVLDGALRGGRELLAALGAPAAAGVA